MYDIWSWEIDTQWRLSRLGCWKGHGDSTKMNSGTKMRENIISKLKKESPVDDVAWGNTDMQEPVSSVLLIDKLYSRENMIKIKVLDENLQQKCKTIPSLTWLIHCFSLMKREDLKIRL